MLTALKNSSARPAAPCESPLAKRSFCGQARWCEKEVNSLKVVEAAYSESDFQPAWLTRVPELKVAYRYKAVREAGLDSRCRI